MSNASDITLNEYALTLIRFKSRQLVGRYGFTRSDSEDIEQDLILDLLTRLDRYDARKGRPATFIRMVIDRRVASLIRERTSGARDYRRRAASLDELSDAFGDSNLAEPAIDDRPQRDLEIDIAEALVSLTDGLGTIAEELRDDTLASVARAHGCSREVMRRHAKEIRQHFTRCGLGEYVTAHQNGAAQRM